MNDGELASLVESLRQELRKLGARVGAVEGGFDAIETSLSQAAALAESDIAAPLDEQGEADESGPQEDDGSSLIPDLAVLRPWVAANISSWCERQMMSNARGGGRGIRWCSRWDEHPEAISRLWVVRAVQLDAAQQGPVAVSQYLRDCFDHHLAVLTDANGPFHNCSFTEHLSEQRGTPRYLPTLGY